MVFAEFNPDPGRRRRSGQPEVFHFYSGSGLGIRERRKKKKHEEKRRRGGTTRLALTHFCRPPISWRVERRERLPTVHTRRRTHASRQGHTHTHGVCEACRQAGRIAVKQADEPANPPTRSAASPPLPCRRWIALHAELHLKKALHAFFKKKPWENKSVL